MLASFIVLMFNKPEITIQCVETLDASLTAFRKDNEVEIILVDNGSEEEHIQRVLETIGHKIRYIGLKDNMGYCYGINKGLSEAKGEIIAILNNDLIFIEGWLELLVAGLYKEGFGLVAPMLSNCEGVQNLGLQLDPDGIEAYGKQYMAVDKKTKSVTKIIGACMVMTRRTFNKLGGLDYWFSLGHYDDDDYCYRARLAGIPIGVVTQSFVYHIGSATFQEQKELQQELVVSNRNKFMCKYGYQWRHDQLIHVPVKEQDFSSALGQLEEDELWIADWHLPSSNWREKSKKRDLKKQIAVWIPKGYFTDEDCNQVRQYFGNQNVKYLYDSIYAKDLKRFCGGFKNIAVIEDDTINKVFRYMFRLDSNNQKAF